MRLNVAGFVDVGFVRAAVAQACGMDKSQVRLNAAALVGEVQQVAERWSGLTLRVYWYDGQHPQSDPRHLTQRKYLDAVAATPGIQLRLGHVTSRTPAWHGQLERALAACGVDRAQFARQFTLAPEYQQKGVDTLMVLDILRFAQRRAYDIAVVFSGDRDIAEAVRAAQDEGRRVTLIAPDDRSVAPELRALADEVVVFDQERLAALHLGKIPTRPHTTGAPGAAGAEKPAPPTFRPGPAPAPVAKPVTTSAPVPAAPEPAPAEASAPPVVAATQAPPADRPAPAPAAEPAEPADATAGVDVVGELFGAEPAGTEPADAPADMADELFGEDEAAPDVADELFGHEPEPQAANVADALFGQDGPAVTASPWGPVPTRPAAFGSSQVAP